MCTSCIRYGCVYEVRVTTTSFSESSAILCYDVFEIHGKNFPISTRAHEIGLTRETGLPHRVVSTTIYTNINESHLSGPREKHRNIFLECKE